MPQITIMDGTGDSVVPFDPSDETSLAEARAMFDQLIAPETGRRAFAIAPDAAAESETPGQGVPIETFDPTAEEIIFIAPYVGG